MSTGATSVHLPALSEAEFEVLGEHVFCDDRIGIDWREVGSMLADDVERQRRDSRNEKVMRALALVEEHDETRSDEGERAELHRLEGKVDLLLELVTVLVRDSHDGIGARNARFNPRGLCWDEAKPVPKGALLDVDVYLLMPWPLSLKLYARVVDSVERGGGYRVCTRIEGLAGASRDWFGKLVFRRHRRAVAQQRKRT